MKSLTPSQVTAILIAARRGTPALETAHKLGVRKDTVLKYQRKFFEAIAPPKCGCGRPSTHTGQCKIRAAARKATYVHTEWSTGSFLIPNARTVHGYAGAFSA